MKIIFFGDSVCVGQHVTHHKSWVSMISQKLEDRAIILNSSVNGRTTRQALEDMPYHIQGQKADILILQFGLNDCNYWISDKGLPRVSPKAFEANLEEIIDRAYNFDVSKVFLNNNHPTLLNRDKIPHTDITYEDSNKKYNNIVREVAERNNVIFNDIERTFLNYEKGVFELLLPDFLHLSIRGHQLYFDIIYPYLIREILELSK